MRIKHITLMAGPAGTFPPGAEREINDDQGAALIAGGYAIEVTRRMPETATARPLESAEQQAAAHLGNVAAAGRGKKPKANANTIGNTIAPTSEE